MTLHIVDVAVLCMLYKIRCDPMQTLCGVLPVPYVPVQVTHVALVAHRYIDAQPRSIAGLLFPSQCLCRTILLTLYAMVCD